jgi:hypothetical protein
MSTAQRNFLTGSFNPMSLSPALWLSDTGSDPAVWTDISGNGRNAIQATAAAQPAIVPNGLNGRQVRRFNGTNNFMTHGLSGSLTSSFSIFAVVKIISIGSGYRSIFACGNDTQGSIIATRLNASSGRWGTYTTIDAPANTTLATGQSVLLTMIDSAAGGGSFFINGASNGTWTGNTVGQGIAQIGGWPSIDQAQNCDIAELIVFPTALSATDRQNVEAYLRNKWDIAFNPLLLSPALWLSDTGSDPAVWPDISGNNRNATAGAGQEPAIVSGAQNGRQVRRFNGSNNYMSCGDVIDVGTGEITLFAVTKINSGVSAGIVGKSVADAQTGRYSIVRSLSNLETFGAFNANRTDPPVAQLPSDSSAVMRVLGGVLTRGNSTLYVNGSLAATVSFSAVNTDFNNNYPLYIGAYQNATGTAPLAGYFLNGDIAEILIFQRALSSTDRQNVEAYLRAKWATDFNPKSLSPALWLSDTGSDPAVWTDISGNGRNATQATAANQPAIVTGALNGRQVRRFDGVDDVLSLVNVIGTSNNQSIFTVAKISAAKYGGIITAKTVNFDLAPAMNINVSRAVEFYYSFNNSEYISSAPQNLGAAFVTSYVKNGTNLSAWLNGSNIGSKTVTSTLTVAATNAIGTYRVGDSNFMEGDIAEILVFPTALSTADRLNVEAYLKNKWMPDFNPISLSPALWLSDTGSDAAVWSDISGNGRNATQSDPNKRPAVITNAQNGRQVRRFDGVDDGLIVTHDSGLNFGTGDFSVFIVAKYGSLLNNSGGLISKDSFAGGSSYTGWLLNRSDAEGGFGISTRRIVSGSGPNYAARYSASSITNGSFYQHQTIRASSVLRTYLDGVLKAQTTESTQVNLDNTTNLTVGFLNAALPGQYMQGDIAEILVFSRALNTTERQAVETYLRTKWGTP